MRCKSYVMSRPKKEPNMQARTPRSLLPVRVEASSRFIQGHDMGFKEDLAYAKTDPDFLPADLLMDSSEEVIDVPSSSATSIIDDAGEPVRDEPL